MSRDRIYQCPEAELLAELRTTRDGLTAGIAAERLRKVGLNLVATGRRRSFFLEIAARCSNPLAIQLLVIAGASYLMGDLRSALVVGGMLVLSVFLSFFQETRSTRAAEKLQKLVKTTGAVLRDGREVEIPIEEVVPGDVVVLAAGSIIPADLRLLAAKDFFVTQSALTGESMPVEKNAEPAAAAHTALESPNACFMGSNVLSGTARGVVVSTGRQTVFGALSQKLLARRQPTDFEKGIRSFTWLMIRFMIVMVALTFLINGLCKHDWKQALLFGLSVAVGLTPEMLPMIVTVCLGKGALQMARKRVIVKHLNAIQNFGAMDVLCTDKTGTLTQDRVVLERYVDVTGRPSEDVLRYAYMNSFYQTGLRNLLDRAVLAHSEIDVERDCCKVDEIPFDFQRRRMSVVIDHEDRHVLICKGAVEEVARVCMNYQVDDDINPLIQLIRDDLMDEYRHLSTEGYRVLAIAYREFDRSKKSFNVADESEMVLLGYIAFFDPAKESSAEAIQALARSGVAVKILTGDNELVSQKVCRDVGLAIHRVVTGPQLAALDEAEFARQVQTANVFARLTPDQKEKIICALRAQGRVVGFLGDGINDVLAMKAADVGISVDSAVDVAKESADIILLEKSLLALEDGILEGRKVFGNIIKYIKMGASSNFGNMFSVLGASALFPFLPMAPIQVLLNNLLYDFSQAGIPLDNVDEEYIARPRRWNIASIRNFMLFLGPISSLFDYATFALMWFFFRSRCLDLAPPAALAGQFSKPRAAPDDTYAAALFHTGWFLESLLTQTLIVHIIRTNRIPFVQSRPSKTLLACSLTIMAIGAILPFSPLAHWLGLVPLPAVWFLWIAGFLLAYSLLAHTVKVWFARKFGVD